MTENLTYRPCSSQVSHPYGQPIAQYGKLYFYGYMKLPEPKVALVYSVPRGTTGWFLKDGKQKYRVL